MTMEPSDVKTLKGVWVGNKQDWSRLQYLQLHTRLSRV